MQLNENQIKYFFLQVSNLLIHKAYSLFHLFSDNFKNRIFQINVLLDCYFAKQIQGKNYFKIIIQQKVYNFVNLFV